MSLKVHYLITIQAPNESDPDGYYISACGRESFELDTTDSNAVTCKQCIKALNNSQWVNQREGK